MNVTTSPPCVPWPHSLYRLYEVSLVSGVFVSASFRLNLTCDMINVDQSLSYTKAH